MDFTDTLKTIALSSPGKSLGLAGAQSLHTSPSFTTGQSSDWTEMFPGVGLGLGLSQPLCRQQVTSRDIERQIGKVKKSRERLTVALSVDRATREAESKELRRTP